MCRDLLVRDIQMIEMKQMAVEPLTVRMSLCISLLALGICEDLTLFSIDNEHPAR